MEASVDWLFFMVLFCGLLGLVVSLILYFLNRNASFSPRVLAGIVFSFVVISLTFGLMISGQFIHFPHFWRVAIPFTLSFSPLTYIYVRSVLAQQFRFKRSDLFLFLPAILYCLQMMPLYLKSAAEKEDIIRKALADHTLIAREPEGLLPEGWGIILRLVFNLAVLGFAYRLLLRSRERVLQPGHSYIQNREIYQWLVFLILVLSSTNFIYIFEYLFQISRYYELFRLMSLTMCGTTLSITAYLLIKPNILYGLKGWLQESLPGSGQGHAGPEVPPWMGAFRTAHVTETGQPGTVQSGLGTASLPKVQTKLDGIPGADTFRSGLAHRARENSHGHGGRRVTLSREQGTQYAMAIEKHFRENAPFAKPGYAIKDLSAELHIPSYQLSAFINQEYGKNFNEFINEARIDYLLSHIGDVSEVKQFTLEALGQSVGFKSRTAFIAAVKRKTGKTPSELLLGRGLS